MNGVIERVIENWLTNATERSYQLPFCQLLAAEGESVVYISSHGQMEQGKDVISLDQRGRPKAYQLKSGDFALADWREHKGELTDLIELPIQHPGISTGRQPSCFLVTNGEIKDPAIKAISSANTAWHKRRYPSLQTISKGALLSRFLAVHGTCLPKELVDFNLFLELTLNDGTGPLEKAKVSKMLESVLPIQGRPKIKKTDIERAIASSVLLMGYVLQNAYRVGNHWAIFEGWTLAGSYLLAVASKHDLTNDAWTDSFGICEMGAERALIELCDECEQAMTLVQSDPFTDGHFYHVRITILVGLLSALRLYSHLKQPAERGPEFASQFLRTWRFKMKTWGESATPYFALAALASETAGEQAAAEAIALNTIRTVLEINGRRDGSPGLPSPYYSAEESLGFAYGTKERPRESFVGAAYTIHPLIDFLVRRWRRQALWSLWNPITGTTMQSFEPANDWDWFRWHTEEGVLNSRLLGSPQSWATLVREVGTVKIDSLPIRLRDRPRFALFFALVYPHRFTRELLRLIEISCGFGSS